MKMQLVRFSENLDDVNDSQFIKARIRCFSDGLTSHGYCFDLDTVKSAEKTLLGKPILWAYDFWNDDCKGHEKSEVPCGFISDYANNANISYVYDKEYNKTFCEVDCYIWRVYAEKLDEILQRDNGVKDVSVEILILDEKANSVYRRTDVTNYCYTGITILGEAINPAVKGAKLEVTKFSENEYEKAKNEFIKEKLCNSEKVGESKIMNSEIKKDDNAEVIETVRVNVSKDTMTYDDNGKPVGSTYESHTKSETTSKQVDDTTNTSEMQTNACKTDKNVCKKEDNGCKSDKNVCKTEKEEDNTCKDKNECKKEDNGCQNKEKCENTEDKKEDNKGVSIEEEYKVKYNEMSAKFSELQKSYDDLNKEYETLKVECSDLRDYKSNVEKVERNKVLEKALSEVSAVFSADEMKEWREKAINCENVDAFKNELKASAYDRKVKCSETRTIRNAIPLYAEDNTSNGNVWDRMKNEI